MRESRRKRPCGGRQITPTTAEPPLKSGAAFQDFGNPPQRKYPVGACPRVCKAERAFANIRSDFPPFARLPKRYTRACALRYPRRKIRRFRPSLRRPKSVPRRPFEPPATFSELFALNKQHFPHNSKKWTKIINTI